MHVALLDISAPLSLSIYIYIYIYIYYIHKQNERERETGDAKFDEPSWIQVPAGNLNLQSVLLDPSCQDSMFPLHAGSSALMGSWEIMNMHRKREKSTP